MTATHWKNQVSANFNNAGDWSTGAVPGSGDDAIIDAPGTTAYTVSTSTSETVSSIQTASTATLAVGGGTNFSALNGTGSGVNAGELLVNDKGTLTLAGAVDNTGQIVVHSGGDLTSLVVSASGLTLSGHGQVNLTGNANEIVGSSIGAPVLTNIDNTIAGQGLLGAATPLTIINQSAGVIDATGATEKLALDAKGAGVTNAGLIEATGAAGLLIKGTKIHDVTGGTISAASGSTVQLYASTIIGGVLETSGTGVIETTSTKNLFEGGSAQLVNKGAVDIQNATALELKGKIVNEGTISLLGSTAATNLLIGLGLSLSGHGKVVLGNSTLDRVSGTASSVTLTNVDNTILGAGLLGSGVMGLVNDAAGVVDGNSAGALTIDAGANTITNAGLIESTGAGGVTVKSAINNTGTLAAAGGVLILENAVSGAGSATINGGTLDVATTSFNENVAFTGGTGVLELANSQAYTGAVTGLSLSGASSLDLLDIGFTSGVTNATYVDNGHQTGGVLTVTDGAHTAKITLVGDYASSTFTTSTDGHGGTTVVDPSARPQAFAALMASFGTSVGASVAAHTWSQAPAPSLLQPSLVHA